MSDTDLRTIIVGGEAILCAARVEQVVEPGQIWATEEFREQFLQRPSLAHGCSRARADRERSLQRQEARHAGA